MRPADALQTTRSLGMDPPIPADADPDVLLRCVRHELALRGLRVAAARGCVELAGHDLEAPLFSPSVLMVSRGTVTVRQRGGAPHLETSLRLAGRVPLGGAIVLAMATVLYADHPAVRLALLVAIAALYGLGAVLAAVSVEGWISDAAQRGCARPDWAPRQLP
ncbi:MAG TPA: hypothetical protein VFJ82_23395 [Longimicrobium sp.]|nr:hypothetical protein [Longimicrobium sp.]